MKQSLFFLLAFFALSSCHFTTGSGNIVSEKRTTSEFTGISVSGGIEVELKVGPVASVTIEADDNIIGHVETIVNEGILKIRTKNLHNTSNIHLKAYITAPAITSINTSGGSDVVVKDVLKSDSKLSFELSGGGSITAAVDAPDVDTDMSGGGTIKLTGRTKNYEAEVSGGGDLHSYDLMSENTKVSVSGGGSASVHASVKLVASASGGGDITYHGAATVEKSISGGGSINQGN
jgi:hypothetical protein